MSLKLAIIRHAKASWDYSTISDFDRPLKESGIMHTIEIAKKLTAKKISPSLIISSPAIRAIHTALIIARELNYPCENIEINSSMYSDSEEVILKLIKSTDEHFHNLFIFGHNPTFTYLSNQFLKQEIDNIPTAGAVIIDFDVSGWEDISKKTAVSEMFIFPKN